MLLCYTERMQYAGWEMQGMDIDEEEEDAELEGADAEEEEEEEEEESDPNRAVKQQLGDTTYYCPVALQEKGVLWPGNPEVAAKYREKIYYISTSEAREKFLENPTAFLPKEKPFDVSINQGRVKSSVQRVVSGLFLVEPV